MSPGYDFPAHWSFERAVKIGCLVCHVGRAEPEGDAVHRINIREQAIGCESCHGPGSRHVAYHRANKHPEGEEDPTIVNPGKLPRDRLEAVCASCHLSGVATIYLRGRQVTDFRPGMPLTDYRVDYRYDCGSEKMTVVSHIEQLRRSACYQKSKDLTCLTCHDPHARHRPKDPVAFHRQKCLDCHTVASCGLKPEQRRAKDPADNCMACHMPRGDTDIPHVAFTHHRIGRHPAPAPLDTGRHPELVPIDDVSRLAAIDRDRNLGLAYQEVSGTFDPDNPARAVAYRQRARGLLEGVLRAGLRDGPTHAALARSYWADQDHRRAGVHAQEALQIKELPADDRALSLIILADSHMREGNFAPAIELLEKLTRLRRYAEDWRLLGICYLQTNQPRKALAAVQQALAIRPFRPDTHAVLADVYLRLGDVPRAKEHQEKARWLAEHSQQ
jgi:hypothetical protein